VNILLFADTHIAKAIVIQLRNKGIYIVRLEEVAALPNNASDSEILRYATEQGRAVLSLDDDFETLHYEYLAEGFEHAGIFWGHHSLQGNIGTIVNFIVEYNQLVEDASVDIHKQLIRIKKWRGDT
jgi:uncharacterized protein DUF5615